MEPGATAQLAVQSGQGRTRGKLLVSEETKQRTLPEFAQDIYKRGLEAANTGRYDEAIGLLSNIHHVLPVFTAAELQIGRCHWEMHRWQSARQHFEIATQLEPNNADAAWTMGLLSLQMGDFKKGWQGYERRWQSKTFKSPKLHTKHPQWERGKGLKRPLIWCEQGIGDQLLYASLIEALAKEVDEVTVMVDLRLTNLLQRGCSADNVKFLTHSARVKMSEHDSHIPIASLGKYFIDSVRDIETYREDYYVKADPERVARLRKEYGLGEDDVVVGLSWTSTAPVIGPHKSVPLADFKHILDEPGVKFINLQYGQAQEEGRDFHPSLITTHVDTFFDLENVAALMEICKLIISPSCATVHLAGAMGKEVLLLDANKLWYWNNRAGNQSLWYPNVQIYQRENMNAPWDLQLGQVKEALEYAVMRRQRYVDPPAVVFFHVGDDISHPQKMVKSVLRYNPNAYIVMCTDTDTPDVMGVSDRFEIEIDRDELIHGRIKAYARLETEGPAIFLDTDMLVQGEIDPAMMLANAKVAVCRRSFNCDSEFNTELRGLVFDEHKGKTMDQVYPYVFCALVTDGPKFWEDLLVIYDTLDPKYRKWYGDQEALRIYAESNKVATFPESIYGCLPEHKTDDAKILHYKGAARKQLFEVS
jgi:hypothetical protein